ncbi:MAG: DUF2231 domain-containing protein [Gemmatimonadales bacterium]
MLFLHGGEAAASFLGYDAVRLHAMLNDLPSALLAAFVIFEVLAILTNRESFRSASFWVLILGTIGAGVAVLSGLRAEDAIEHGQAIHEIMETHEKLAFVTLGIFGFLTLWHLLRSRAMAGGERIAALVLALAGAGFLVATGREGGEMVFDHAAGIPTAELEAEVRNRALGHEHEEGEEHHDDGAPVQAMPDSTAAMTDSMVDGMPDSTAAAPTAGGHTHAPGTPPHED